MINKSDYYIKGLTVSFLTKQHVLTLTSLWLQIWLLKINCSVIFVIPRWEISGWISNGATIVVINVQGFPLSRQGVWLHPCRSVLVWCNCVFSIFFFLIHDLPQLAHWHYYEVIGHKSLRWLPLLFHHHFPLLCLWLLQLYACLTALSSIEISFTQVDNLTKHCFLKPVVPIPRFWKILLKAVTV